MLCHQHNSSCFLAILTIVVLSLAVPNPLNGQQFITPEVPPGQTLDGQTYGSPRQPTVLRGRIIEGRVLTGEDGQVGDGTLRYPRSSASNSSGTNEDDMQVFGPIDIEPLTGNQPARSTATTVPASQSPEHIAAKA